LALISVVIAIIIVAAVKYAQIGLSKSTPTVNAWLSKCNYHMITPYSNLNAKSNHANPNITLQCAYSERTYGTTRLAFVLLNQSLSLECPSVRCAELQSVVIP